MRSLRSSMNKYLEAAPWNSTPGRALIDVTLQYLQKRLPSFKKQVITAKKNTLKNKAVHYYFKG